VVGAAAPRRRSHLHQAADLRHYAGWRTQIAPALTELSQILTSKASTNTIVLLTDGISEEGDSMTLSKDAVANHVTISTVGLGQDVNGPSRKSRAAAQGKAYFLNDPSGLEQIGCGRQGAYRLHGGGEDVHPEYESRRDSGRVGIETAPPLRGYVRFLARPTTDLILRAGPEDPLLVRWQYGLGRAAVFTSDAKNRWPQPGWLGPDSTSCGPTSSGISCRTPNRARPPPNSTGGQRVGGGLSLGPRRAGASRDSRYLRVRSERFSIAR